MDTLWLKIDKKIFNDSLDQAIEDSISNYGKEDNSYLWEYLQLTPLENESIDYENGEISINSNIIHPSFGEMGGTLIKIKLTDDVAIKIIQDYIKRLNRIKTVLEATK